VNITKRIRGKAREEKGKEEKECERVKTLIFSTFFVFLFPVSYPLILFVVSFRLFYPRGG